MTSLKTIDELAPNSIQNYGSRLRQLFLSQSTLAEREAESVRRKIAQLEAQLGLKADSIRSPGRPRRSQSIQRGESRTPNSVFGTRRQAQSFRSRPTSLANFHSVSRQYPERARQDA